MLATSLSSKAITARSAAVACLCFLLARRANGGIIHLELLVRGLERPVAVVGAGDGTGRLFVVEQCSGRVRIVDRETGALKPTAFLEIDVHCDDHADYRGSGLLGLAFHPKYETTGYLFVNFNPDEGRRRTVIGRFSVSADDPDRVDTDSFAEVLSFDQPDGGLHKGGDLAFGPDGYLYVSSGDGGRSADPQNNAQSLDTVLGKVLRLDVDNTRSMQNGGIVPADNPFVGRSTTCDECGAIWSYGVRNPWKLAFDRDTGDLFFGDMGNRQFEEINFQPSGSGGGENYGWRLMEGTACHIPKEGCDDAEAGSSLMTTLTPPIIEYANKRGHCSVIGGYRYRGAAHPWLVSTYFYADLCSGYVWGATEQDDGTWRSRKLLRRGHLVVSSFGQDEAGELYVVDYRRSRRGSVYRVTSDLCVDDGEFRHRNETARTCGWLGDQRRARRRRLCGEEHGGKLVRQHCPSVCKKLCRETSYAELAKIDNVFT